VIDQSTEDQEDNMQLPINYESIERLAIIQEIHKIFKFKKYLEIGCDTNSVFTHLNCQFKIGVDPVRGGNLRMTSDEFFELSNETFDLIFIDGLHYYEQVSRDFDNSLARLNPGRVILIHDILPTQAKEVVVPAPRPLASAWTGDVWRLSFDLMARTDIRFHILNSPWGLGLVTRGHQQPKILPAHNHWNWYAENWQHLPIVSCEKSLACKFSNLITEI